MNTQLLSAFLDQEELKFRSYYQAQTPNLSSQEGVDVQCYAYHGPDVLAGEDRVPVICIGSNYGQGADNMGSPNTNLLKWRNGYLKMAQTMSASTWQAQWISQNWSSTPFPQFPSAEKTFFVMTNLCPWITKKEKPWAELNTSEAKHLLKSSQSSQGEYEHLNQLFTFLKKSETDFIVVGHGINDNIRNPLLTYLRTNHGTHPWLLYANWSIRNWTPYKWQHAAQKFVFGTK